MHGIRVYTQHRIGDDESTGENDQRPEQCQSTKTARPRVGCFNIYRCREARTIHHARPGQLIHAHAAIHGCGASQGCAGGRASRTHFIEQFSTKAGVVAFAGQIQQAGTRANPFKVHLILNA